MIYKGTGTEVTAALRYNANNSSLEFARIYQGNTRWIQPSDKNVFSGTAVISFHYKPQDHIGRIYYNKGTYRYTKIIIINKKIYFVPIRLLDSSNVFAGNYDIYNGSYSSYMSVYNGGTIPGYFRVDAHSSSPKISGVKFLDTQYLIATNQISNLVCGAVLETNSSGDFIVGKEYTEIGYDYNVKDLKCNIRGYPAYLVQIFRHNVSAAMTTNYISLMPAMRFNSLGGDDGFIEILEAIYTFGGFNND